MKFKMRQLLELVEPINKIMTAPLDDLTLVEQMRFSFKVSPICVEIMDAVNKYKQLQSNKIIEYAPKDEQGNPIRDIDGLFRIKDPVLMEKANEEMVDAINEEIVITKPAIPFKVIEKLKIKGLTLAMIFDLQNIMEGIPEDIADSEEPEILKLEKTDVN